MRLFAMLLVLSGIAIRIYIYLQNRNLIIDEANIARNLWERNFIELLTPLDYQQYAPPLFLWVSELATVLFGFSEYALRLYPLLCGIGSMVLLYRLMARLVPVSTIWYPVSLLAFAHIFIRYSSEVKQYMGDVFITLFLLTLALSTDIFKHKPIRFFIIWLIAGSLAVWSSMPSVFVLTGVGGYYAWQSIERKEYKKILLIGGVALLWMLQFGAYYFTVLEEQAQSAYLQHFHQYWFLYATPENEKQSFQNWAIFSDLLRQFEGLSPYVYEITLGLILGGVASLLVSDKPKGVLLITPVVLMLLAAALNKFSLMPRVALFGILLFIILAGYGFGQMAYFRFRILKVLFVTLGLYCTWSNIQYLQEKDDFKYEEITQGMQFLIDHDIPGKSISVIGHAEPTFLYYTRLHPDSNQWQIIKNADIYPRGTKYDTLASSMRYAWSTRQYLGFIYTNALPKEMDTHDSTVNVFLDRVDSLVTPYGRTYIYIRPKE